MLKKTGGNLLIDCQSLSMWLPPSFVDSATDDNFIVFHAKTPSQTAWSPLYFYHDPAHLLLLRVRQYMAVKVHCDGKTAVSQNGF